MREGRILVGSSGKEFTRMVRDAGMERRDSYLTNVFPTRPPNNKVEGFCFQRKGLPLPPGYTQPALNPTGGWYVRPEWLVELQRLKQELEVAKPNIVVAMGNTALWALTGESPRIGKLRGTLLESSLVPGLKVLPTYHPAAVVRNWSLRVVVLMDLLKVAREQGFPAIRRPHRELWLNPSIADLHEFGERFLDPAHLISTDVETIPGKRQILCVSLTPTPDRSLIIPFVDRFREGYSYWSTAQQEYDAWIFLHHYCKTKPMLFQNGCFDWMVLLTGLKIRVQMFVDDSMILHHSLYSEMSKGLDFLGSVYTDEVAWKMMRPKGAFAAQQKREE
jgi:uracil-DNA glycosylase